MTNMSLLQFILSLLGDENARAEFNANPQQTLSENGFDNLCGEDVPDHERAVTERDHVELDEVDARLERRAERADRVLGREGGGPAMADPQRPSRAALQRDHGTGRVGR